MGNDTIADQTAIRKIEQQLPELTSDELDHVQHVLNALDASKDGSMHYIGRFLGMEQVEDGIVMDLGPHNENTYGVAQGGALYTLADMAIGFYIMKELSENEQVFTLELKVNFIKKGRGNHLFAKTNILHWGRKTVVADCSIIDEKDQLIAKALGTFYIAK